MGKIHWIAGSCLLIFSSLQAFAWDKMEGVGKASHKGVATVAAEWVKDKDDKYDVSMKFNNDSDKAILFFVGDMKCTRGGDHSGTVDNHSSRRTIDLRAKESRTILMTCRLATKNKGDFSISMKIFANPSGDTNTPGIVLADTMVWKQGQTEGKIMRR